MRANERAHRRGPTLRRAVVAAALVAGSGFAVPRIDAAPAPATNLLSTTLPAARAREQVGDAALVHANARLGARRVTRLLDDPTTWVDRAGQLLVVDDAPPPPRLDSISDPVLSSPYAASKTFFLHSRLGAPRTIFLDFDGATTAGTRWNLQVGDPSFTSPRYDTDGLPAAFSTTELAEIQIIWQRVAEDYAPFDIDVTTHDPGLAAIDRTDPSDLVFGTRVVITQNNPVQDFCVHCSGIAQFGVFDASSSHEFTQPAWVFTTWYGHRTDLPYLATAISHEVGHTLGLSHDGTSTAAYDLGHGIWGPIMGASRHDGLVQWSKGEYADANNTEDDLAVMQTFGAPLLPDDVGDTLGTATALPAPTFDVSGMLTAGTDVDVYTVSLPVGRFEVTALPAPSGANADLKLTLRNPAGIAIAANAPAAVASTTTADALGTAAHIGYTVTKPGVYSLVVSGTGAGDPLLTGYSRYGSVGRYRLTTTTPKVTVTRSGPGTGMVVAVNGTPCGLGCSVAVTPHSTVTLTTKAGSGSVLSRWTGATCTGSNETTCVFDMRALSARIDARFEQPHLLRVATTSTATTPNAYQYVRSDLEGIICFVGYAANCEHSFGTTRTVTLRPQIPASPSPNFAFAFWTGGCTGTRPTCTLSMSSPRSVEAHFAPGRALTINVSAPFYGTVTSNWPERGCPVTYDGKHCVHMMPRYSMVTLTATPRPFATFVGWTGACTGTATTCEVTMNAARAVTATFVRTP